MYNSQAVELSRLSLDKAGYDSLHIGFEPFEIESKSLKNLKTDDLFFIQNSMPKIYIYQGSDIVGQASLGTHNDTDTVMIDANERTATKNKTGKGFTKIYPRFVALHMDEFVVGSMVKLATKASRSILLYDNDKAIATANIMHSKKGYILQIDEVV